MKGLVKLYEEDIVFVFGTCFYYLIQTVILFRIPVVFSQSYIIKLQNAGFGTHIKINNTKVRFHE
jgi:hypothetical protein